MTDSRRGIGGGGRVRFPAVRSRLFEPALARFMLHLATAAACLHGHGAQAGMAAAVESDWRISRAVAAPWAPATPASRTTRTWVGRSVTFQRDSVSGPGALRCGHAVLEATLYPAESLFQGSLPAPAAASAQTLGITRSPLPGIGLTCDTGVFEFHRVDADTLLLGLDNQVLTLSHAPGALAPAHAPEGRVQSLLEAHFSGDMGFSAATVKAKRPWLSARLKQRIAKYFARPASADEVPAIDGDPFTDSQEYPQRFAVGKAVVSNGTAEVPVRFTDGFRDRAVVYRMRREGGAWRVDDLRYEGGETLRGLLR